MIEDIQAMFSFEKLAKFHAEAYLQEKWIVDFNAIAHIMINSCSHLTSDVIE